MNELNEERKKDFAKPQRTRTKRNGTMNGGHPPSTESIQKPPSELPSPHRNTLDLLLLLPALLLLLPQPLHATTLLLLLAFRICAIVGAVDGGGGGGGGGEGMMSVLGAGVGVVVG